MYDIDHSNVYLLYHLESCPDFSQPDIDLTSKAISSTAASCSTYSAGSWCHCPIAEWNRSDFRRDCKSGNKSKLGLLEIAREINTTGQNGVRKIQINWTKKRLGNVALIWIRFVVNMSLGTWETNHCDFQARRQCSAWVPCSLWISPKRSHRSEHETHQRLMGK